MGARTLDELMTVDAAADRWNDKFSRDELLRAAREGELRHVRKGRMRLVTEQWLLDYLAGREVAPCQGTGSGDSSSGDTGSSSDESPTISTATGMTQEEEESAAALLKQKIGKKRRKP